MSKRTQGLLAAAQQAHKAWLRSRSVAARNNSHTARRQADRAVQLDMQQWVIGQADEVDQLLQQRNMRGFAQAARRMAGQQQRSSAPASMQNAAGRVHCGQRGVEQALTSRFAQLLGGKSELTEEKRAQIEAEVLLFESLHAPGPADEAASTEPSIEEVKASIAALRNHAAPGEDLVDAQMLKAGPVVVEWLHGVVSSAWRSGRAPVA